MHPSAYPLTQQEQAKPRRRALARVVRGYLMLIGAGTTVYALLRLFVLLLDRIPRA